MLEKLIEVYRRRAKLDALVICKDGGYDGYRNGEKFHFDSLTSVGFWAAERKFACQTAESESKAARHD